MASLFNTKFFDKFFGQSPTGKLLAKHWIFVFRVDGHLLYGNAPKEVAHTYSALLTGAWHSSFALLETLGSKESEGRLSLEIGDQGMMVCPLNLMKSKLFLGVIFKDVENPGKLKAQLRLATLELEGAVKGVKSEIEILPTKENQRKTNASDRNDFLFKDITDEEMDSLFNFSGI